MNKHLYLFDVSVAVHHISISKEMYQLDANNFTSKIVCIKLVHLLTYLYLCHLLVLSSPTLMMQGHTKLKTNIRCSKYVEDKKNGIKNLI